MSIKPEFINEIVSGNKCFEFRRVLFQRRDISTIVVYASSPISKVVGEFSFDDILTDHPDNIWQKTKEKSGITKSYFDSYFSGKDFANAIVINTFTAYDEPLSLSDINVKRAPQSFCYID